LAVVLHDADATIARANPLKRRFMRMSQRAGANPVMIMEIWLPYPLETLIEEMRQLNPRLVVEA
jgi:hypothetical protein